MNQYVIDKLLGKGSFAKVYLCTDSNTKTKYALKVMDKEKLSRVKMGKGKFAIDSVVDELKILKRLQHPNILWLHEIINDQSKDKLYLVTEWYSRGSLANCIGKDM